MAIARISLSDFIEIVSVSGTPKASVVKQIKNRPPYDPRLDFWKAAREHIAAVHDGNLPKASIGNMLNGLADTKKQTAYPRVSQGYTKWWGNKNIQSFNAPTGIFTGSNVDVNVNPELGLQINGQRHVVKLYLKGTKLAKVRADLALGIMESRLRTACQANDVMAILDIQHSKLFTPTVVIPNLTAMILAELAYIATLWPLV